MKQLVQNPRFFDTKEEKKWGSKRRYVASKRNWGGVVGWELGGVGVGFEGVEGKEIIG